MHVVLALGEKLIVLDEDKNKLVFSFSIKRKGARLEPREASTTKATRRSS